MGVKARLQGIAPWSGLIAAGAAWALHQQTMSQALHFDCRATAGGVDIGWGAVALGLVAAGALLSWRARPARDEAKPALRQFAANLSLMAAMLAALGIVFFMLAGAIVPGCRP